MAGVADGVLPGQTGLGSSDLFIRKYDVHGVEQWTVQFGSEDSEAAYAVSVNPGGLYLTGYTFGALPGQVSAGAPDAFLSIMSAR